MRVSCSVLIVPAVFLAACVPSRRVVAPSPMTDSAPFLATTLFGTADRVDRRDCQAPGESATTLNGTGHGTYLGEFRVTLQICSLVSGWKDGEVIFTAANGDALHLRYAARPMRPGSISDFESRWRVTGGTGQFASIIGEGRVVGTVNLVSGGGRVVWEGELAATASASTSSPRSAEREARAPRIAS